MEAKDVKNLMEAYASLYTESNGEEFETWVNALVEEGYDLSEYTWDDMYEIYMEEVENLDENSRISREPDRRKSHSKQPDPSKPGFTGIGNMNIDQIAKMSANIKKRKPKNVEEEYIDERKYAPDEKLPSGRTPLHNMERAQSKHGANYMTTQGDVRYPGAKNAHFQRGTKVKKIKDIVTSGGDPRNDPSVGPGYDHDARKIGRPQKPMTGRTRRRDETDRERSNYSQGGLRADRTRAGGYRTLVRKEEVDLFDYILEHLITEGYADTNENALVIMANMSEEWRDSILEGEEKKEEPKKPFTGEGPKKPKRWKPTGPKRSYGQRPPSWDVGR